MKKRYVLKICLTTYLFFFFLGFLANAQENSSMYLEIRNDTISSNVDKEVRIDSLFREYNKDVSKKSILPYDLYDYMVWQYRNGSLEKAINISKKCIQAIGISSDFDSLKHKKVHNNLGFFYNKNGDYYQAYQAYKTLTTIGKNDSYTAKAYRLAGRNLTYIGDFYMAADYFETSITLAKELKDYKLMIINSIDAGINYKEIETKYSIKRGIDILLYASKIAEEVNEKSIVESDKIPEYNLFNLYNNLANLYNDRDDYDFENSKRHYDTALKIALKLQDSVLLANVYNDFGYLYLHEAQPEALTYLNEALTYKPDNANSSIIYANKSKYFFKRKDAEKALQNIQISINYLAPFLIDKFENLPSELSVAKSLNKFELLQNLIDKANIWIEFSDDASDPEVYMKNALETFKLADYLVDVIRAESSDQQSKLFWRKVASEVYVNAVKASFKLGNLEDGFYFMEKNKALLLLEDVSLRQQRDNAKLPESIYAREVYLKKKILQDTKLLENAVENDSLNSLVFNSKEIYASFIDSLQEEHALFYRTQKTTQSISLNKTQKTLSKSNEVYIEYILNKEDGYGMLITGTQAKFFEIKDCKNLLARSQQLRKLLASPFKTQEDEALYMELSHRVYKDLFPEEIQTEIKDKKLIIIPDSYLQNIPFEALYTSNKKASYLIKQHEINYAYSISFLDQNKNWERNNTQDFIGFAPVNFKNGLSNLPDSKLELETAGSLFSAVNFFNTDASAQNFIDNVEGHKIVHIASHSNAVDGSNPWIVFDDEKLSLDDLYLTQNSADLVVLSACKTSIGDINEGEGVMSLARGFFNTGAHSVISTLWNVNDKSSSQIIIDFYKEIEKGKTKSEALRTSKLNYLNTHQLSEQSPYFWASFVLIGDAGKVPIASNFNFFYIFISIVILLIISYLFIKKIKK